MTEKNNQSDERADRLRKLEKIQKEIGAYPAACNRTHTNQEALLGFDKLLKNEEKITLVGRIRSIRGHGGSTFCHIEDGTQKIQIYVKKDEVGDDQYQFFSDSFDVADFIEASGTLFLTKREEKTLLVNKFKLLSKALLPLPEKWHGLTDTEIRYRKRYLDLISNPQVKDIFNKRSLIIQKIRELMMQKGYLEVETPILQPIYGGGFAKPFKTKHNSLKMDMYLRISDEMYLKRLIVGGYEKVFEFCKDFRNEGIDRDHNPEFNMLEAMTAYEDYNFSMDLVEEIYEYTAKEVLGSTTVDYQGQKIELKRPWRRAKMVDLVKETTGVDYFKLKDLAEGKKKAQELGIDKEKISQCLNIGSIVALIFEEKVEETLIQPTIVYEHPVETSPLAKKCKDDPRFTERFEHFVLGKEHGNHYSELNDPVDLKQRFIEEKKKVKAGFDEAHQTDNDFLQAIEHGMPPVTGIGIGIDRMVMLLTDSPSIREVIFFPILRNEK